MVVVISNRKGFYGMLSLEVCWGYMKMGGILINCEGLEFCTWKGISQGCPFPCFQFVVANGGSVRFWEDL